MIGENEEFKKDKGTRFYEDNQSIDLEGLSVDDNTHLVDVKYITHKGKKYELQKNGELIPVKKNGSN